MKRIKGCENPKCSAHKAKQVFKDNDRYCTQCSRELSFVCRKCKTLIPKAPVQALCLRCEAERQDKIAKHVDTAKKIALPIAGTLGTVVIGAVKLFKPGSKS